MDDSRLLFEIPLEFITTRVTLTPAELVYGYRNMWIGQRQAIALALAAYPAGDTTVPAHEDLALLLSDEIDRVPGLIDQMADTTPPQDDASSVWLYLALAWIHDQRSHINDPQQLIDMLYSDFDHPEAMNGFVSYLPAEHDEVGPNAMERRWSSFITAKSREYAERGRLPN